MGDRVRRSRLSASISAIGRCLSGIASRTILSTHYENHPKQTNRNPLCNFEVIFPFEILDESNCFLGDSCKWW